MPSPPITKTCEECGRTWSTRRARSRTCSPSCRARLREREKPSPGAQPRDYPNEIIAKTRALYESGATVAEISEAIGPGYRVQTLVERFVQTRRPARPRDQSGSRNPSWTGSAAGYQALHLRVETARGKPGHCSCCDTSDPDQKYEWANLSGAYEDISDYARLCVPCHRRLDARRRAVTGRRTSPPRGGDENV